MMLIGIYKSIDELEESISLDELEAVLIAFRKREEDKQRFSAALKGIDLDEGKQEAPSFEMIKARAEARLAGKSEIEGELNYFGIDVDTE